MSIPNHLVEKFFRGDCTEEERQQVATWLRDNPEKLAQYLTDDNWKNFTPHSQQEVPTERIRGVIEGAIGKMETEPEVYHEGIVDMPARKIRYSWFAAAAVIGAVALFFLLHKNTSDRTTTPELAATKPAPVQQQARMWSIDNNTARVRTCILPDGSKVELSGKTTISFDSTFTGGRRAIVLQQGEAVFTVKKDPKPFVVYSKGITTTALGTVFSVSDKQRLFTTVHLFSGKVVVKKAAGEKGGSFKDVYLKPGQQLVLNKENFSVQIKEEDITPPTIKAPVPAEQVIVNPGQVLDFANRPLGEILSLLQQEYKVSISYDPAALQNMTFTGKLNRDKESLESFLSTLCDLNDLSLKKINDNSFSIQLKQP